MTEILCNWFGIVQVNAIYSILYFLENNILFFFTIFAISFLIFAELKANNDEYVYDNRRVI